MKTTITNCALFTTIVVVVSFNFLPAQPFQNYLQADFKFTDGSLSDASPNMLHGSGFDITATMGIEGAANSAYHYNGLSSFVDCGTDDRNISNQLTVSVWFRTTASSTTNRQQIVDKYYYDDDQGYFLSLYQDAAAAGGRDGSGTYHEMNSGGWKLNDGNWHHMVMTMDVNEWKLYVDCQLVDELTTTTVNPDLTNPQRLAIGRISRTTGDGRPLFFEGDIDNVKIYNTALSAEEVQQISAYTCPASTPDLLAGLVAYYPLNGDALDYSGNELHGTLNGAIPAQDRFDLSSNALQFDGLDDHILVGENDLLDFGTGDFAISLWVKALDPEGGPQMLVHKGISGTGGQYWFRENEYDNFTRLAAAVADGDPPGTFLSSTEPIFDDQEWHHLVYQRTSAALEIWVDCELKERLLDTRYRNVDNDGNLIIGAQNPWPTGGNFPYIHNHFNGFMDEVRLYNRALSPQEVIAVSNTYCPTNLVVEEDPIYCLYQADNILSTSGAVSIAQKTIFKAGTAVKLLPGFWAPAGSGFSAVIDECYPAVPTIIATESGSTTLEYDMQLSEGPFTMQVAPNPAQAHLRISLHLEEPMSGSMELLDLTGRSLQPLFAGRDLEAGMQTFEVDISPFPVGMYVLRFQSEKGILTHKIIKNR